MPYSDIDQQRAYQREWKARRREEWIQQHGPCARCGSSDDLQVDHILSSEKVDHKVWSWSQARRDAELAKCQVLCRACHSAKSGECGDRPVTVHGTGQMYQAHRCRCEVCRKWKQESDKKYREAKKKRMEGESGGTGACLESNAGA